MDEWINNVKVFSFDMGYTLFDYQGLSEPSLSIQQKILMDNLRRANIEIEDDDLFFQDYLRIDREIYERRIAKLEDSKYLYPRLEMALKKYNQNSFSQEELIQLSAPMLNFRYSSQNLILEPKVPELLACLQNHQKSIIMISNFPLSVGPGQPVFLEKLLMKSGIRHFFDHIIISGEHEIAKPHAALFQKALDLTSVSPAEMVHVGDDFHADIEGAQKLGIKSIWIQHPHHITKATDHILPNKTFTGIGGLYEWLLSVWRS